MQSTIEQPGETPDAMFMTTQQVASLLSLGERTVRNLVRRGQLPQPTRIGRSVRWNREVILAALAERNGSPAAGGV